MLIKIDKKIRNMRVSLFLLFLIITICGIYYTRRQSKESDFLGTETDAIKAEVLPAALKNIEPIRVEVIGNVENPGIYVLEAGNTINDAVEKAGGNANSDDGENAVFDMERIEVPLNAEEESKISYSPALVAVEYSPEIEEHKKQAQVLKININTANAETLESLPHIGEKLAQAIVEYRKEHGNFTSIEQIMNVPKIGDKTFEDLKEYITIDD